MKEKSAVDTEILWQNFKQGDRSAFNTLLQEYYSMLLKYGVRLVGNKEYVEDLLHDFFIELWNSRERLGDAEVLKAYLISSFKRKLLREKKTRYVLADDIDDDYVFDVQFDIESMIIEGEIEIEKNKTLKHHLEKLPKRQKEAIYLRFFEKLEYPDIAKVMEINHHSAVNLVYNAIKILRENWILLWFFIYTKFF